jgi:hypothetical protein
MQHEQREEEVNKETVDHDGQFSILKGKVNSPSPPPLVTRK